MVWGVAIGMLLAAATAPVPLPGAFDIQAEDYPREVIQKGIKGIVEAKLEVDAEGVPSACSTDASSIAELREPTCRVLMRARFEPARNSGGRPVAATLTKRIRWSFDVTNSNTVRVVIARFEIDAAGQVVRCVDSARRSDADDRGWCGKTPDPAADARFLERNVGRPLKGLASLEYIFTSGPADAPAQDPDAQLIVVRRVLDSAELEIAPTGLVTVCRTLDYAPVDPSTAHPYCSVVDGNSRLLPPDPAAALRRLRIVHEWIGRKPAQ